MSSGSHQPPPKLTITGYSFMLTADNHHQNGEKKTFLNVEYELQNFTHHAQIPMHKDEFSEIRGDLNASDRLIQLLRARHI